MAAIDFRSEIHEALHEVEERGAIDVVDEFPVRSHTNRPAAVYHPISAEDAFQSYLCDIRSFGLLTHEEEIDLARRVAAGDERARRTLIGSNLRLVITIARRYTASGACAPARSGGPEENALQIYGSIILVHTGTTRLTIDAHSLAGSSSLVRVRRKEKEIASRCSVPTSPLSHSFSNQGQREKQLGNSV